jgi:hypothetical protein
MGQRPHYRDSAVALVALGVILAPSCTRMRGNVAAVRAPASMTEATSAELTGADRERRRVDGGSGGTFRGGYYVETQLNGHGCDYATTAHDVTYWDYSTGFRCCA